MDMSRYYAVGFPAGAFNDEQIRYLFTAEKLLGIKKITYQIWLCFLGGNTPESVIKNQDFSIYDDPVGLWEIIEEMARTGLLISEEDILNYIPLRHGVGAGHQEDGSFLIYTDKPHKTAWLSYLIWLYSDGRHSFAGIFEQLSKLNVEIHEKEAKKEILSLLDESVLFLSQEA